MKEPEAPLAWFEGYGIEIEWMVVDQETLAVAPIVDRILFDLAGKSEAQVELGPVAWSNELARHVIEIKTSGPAAELGHAASDLQAAVRALQPLLSTRGARLLPSAMHPFMDPDREFRIWPSDDEGIYGTLDRIFDCRGHGWSNLQSMHLNLPFSGDEQFGLLHDAVRTLLPVLPALAASSPLKESRWCANLDERLLVYRTNAQKISSITGQVVPERVRTRAEYETLILEPIYRDLAPYDAEGTLAHEWVNARGAIARFDRSAIEIRVLDAQECVSANLAIAHGVAEVLRKATLGDGPRLASDLAESRLLTILEHVASDAEHALIEDAEYVASLGVESAPSTAGELWAQLLARVPAGRRSPKLWPVLQQILEHGCLARRIRRALGDSTERADLVRVYSALADCVQSNVLFLP